jgi:acyl carrier protein
MNKEAFMEDLAAILEVGLHDLNDGFVLDKSNWNSLAIVTAIVLIDEQFGIKIPGDKLRGCSSVGALWDLINNGLRTKS